MASDANQPFRARVQPPPRSAGGSSRRARPGWPRTAARARRCGTTASRARTGRRPTETGAAGRPRPSPTARLRARRSIPGRPWRAAASVGGDGRAHESRSAPSTRLRSARSSRRARTRRRGAGRGRKATRGAASSPSSSATTAPKVSSDGISPYSPSPSTSRLPGLRVATTTVPQAMASRYGRPKPSYGTGRGVDPRPLIQHRQLGVRHAGAIDHAGTAPAPSADDGQRGRRVQRPDGLGERVQQQPAALAAVQRADEQHRRLGALRVGHRVEQSPVHAVRNHVGDGRVVAPRVLADADDAALQRGRRQFLEIDAVLQQPAAPRLRRPRLAAGAAVHHSQHRLAGEAEQQAVAVRHDHVEVAIVGHQPRAGCPDSPSSAGGRSRSRRTAFHGSGRTSYRGAGGAPVVGEHHDVVAALHQALGQRVGGALDAAAFLALDGQAVAEHRDAVKFDEAA